MTPFVLALLAAEPSFQKVETVDGVEVEQRPVAGSSFVELRFRTSSDKPVRALCRAAFGDGSFDRDEPDLKSRKILLETEHERVTYDQITPPLVSNRDYVVRARRSEEGASCRVTFEAAHDLGPRPPDGWVRVSKLKGFWSFEPMADGKTQLTYVVFTDPGGSLPPFMVEGSRRKLGVRWVKLIDSRATRE